MSKMDELFNHEGARRWWLRVRIPVGLLAAIGLLFLIQPEWLWLGFSVSLFGELIQLWCFANLWKGEELACTGPYAFVRNPMYLGRYFIVLGLIMLLGMPGVLVWPVYTVFYWFYMKNRVAREEMYLKDALGSDYAAYCGRINRFVPSFRACPPETLARWDGALFTQNHGWSNLLALLAIYATAFVVAGRFWL